MKNYCMMGERSWVKLKKLKVVLEVGVYYKFNCWDCWKDYYLFFLESYKKFFVKWDFFLRDYG